MISDKNEGKRKRVIVFPRLCEYGCGKHFDKPGNNEFNYTKHLENCKFKPKKSKVSMLSQFTKVDSGNSTVVTPTPIIDILTHDAVALNSDEYAEPDVLVSFSLKAAEKSTKTSPCTNRPVVRYVRQYFGVII